MVSENMTLDGVVQDPTGEEGTPRGGWFLQVSDDDREAWTRSAVSEASAADAILFGRRSYQFFAARWPARSGELADRLNALPKYVLSSTLEDPAWNPCTVMQGDAEDEVSRLKRELEGEIVVYASFQLVHTLIERRLADELRVTVYPVVLGAGQRLFDEATTGKSMRLVSARTVGHNLAHLTYCRP